MYTPQSSILWFLGSLTTPLTYFVLRSILLTYPSSIIMPTQLPPDIYRRIIQYLLSPEGNASNSSAISRVRAQICSLPATGTQRSNQASVASLMQVSKVSSGFAAGLTTRNCTKYARPSYTRTALSGISTPLPKISSQTHERPSCWAE